MENENRFFIGQDKEELVIDFFRKHWIVIIPEILIFILTTGTYIFLLINLPAFRLPFAINGYYQFLLITGIIIFELLLHRFFLKIMEHLLNFNIITNLRLVEVKKTVFTNDIIEAVAYELIKDDIKKAQHGFWKNVLNYGEIVFNVDVNKEENKSWVIRFVPRPDYYFQLLVHMKHEFMLKQMLGPRHQMGSVHIDERFISPDID